VRKLDASLSRSRERTARRRRHWTIAIPRDAIVGFRSVGAIGSATREWPARLATDECSAVDAIVAVGSGNGGTADDEAVTIVVERRGPDA
jgi:hypothetical protein